MSILDEDDDMPDSAYLVTHEEHQMPALQEYLQEIALRTELSVIRLKALSSGEGNLPVRFEIEARARLIAIENDTVLDSYTYRYRGPTLPLETWTWRCIEHPRLLASSARNKRYWLPFQTPAEDGTECPVLH